MEFDPNNVVVQLCVKGMTAEGEGNIDEAKRLFQQAWNVATNNFEAFTAAHYLARNQADPNIELKWNLEALRLADTLEGDGMKSHYPSLYLNAGKSYETLGDIEQATSFYQKAAESSEYLPAGGYTDMIRSGIGAALKRVGKAGPVDEKVQSLVYAWCERKELRPLSMILPAYVNSLSTANDRTKLLSVFSYLSATRCLSVDEQSIVGEIIASLSANS
jgi:tetratricopeptide (TPR) repeat protein